MPSAAESASSAVSPTVSPTAPRAHLFGVSVALVTPFKQNGAVDLGRLAAHSRALMAGGADGLTLFGTTGEGASLGLSERAAMLDSLIGADIAPEAITVGIAACDTEAAVAQAELAFARGVRRLLLAPPFYFKDIDEDALFDWVAGFVAATEGAKPQIILYHIPQVTGVSFDAPLIRRLKDRLGDTIFGVKDSAGDWSHTAPLLAMDDLVVLIGDERLLARAAPLGGAGAISGMANLMPQQIGALIHLGQENPALVSLVNELVKAPVTPMVKALVGAALGDDGWSRTRPPLSPADSVLVAKLAPLVDKLRC